MLVLMPDNRALGPWRLSQFAKYPAFLAWPQDRLARPFQRPSAVSACHQPRAGRMMHFPMNHRIHHLAVWVLALIHFFIGVGWYALFGEAWLNYNARTMTDIEQPHNAVLIVVAAVAALLVNYALAWLFAKMHVAHALTGLKIALICWLGFLFAQYAAISVYSAFETNPWPLILINMGRPLLAFAISGIVLGAWRLREL